MNDDEKYFFDLNGYIVLEDTLTAEQVAACNAAIDHNRDRLTDFPSRAPYLEGLGLARGSKALAGEKLRLDFTGMLAWPKPWCDPFRHLLDHPSIVPHLVEILRDGFRLDHLYGIVMREGTEGHRLHGGGTVDDFTSFYQFHNGHMRNGLSVVSWILTDCGPGDGGFACIPGSHKANYRCPPDVALLDTDIGMVRQVEAKAGSAVLFTEALTHGTLPWKADHERRSILYKYSPGTLSYSKRYVPPGVEDVLDEFTPEQRAVLEPPYRTNRPLLDVG